MTTVAFTSGNFPVSGTNQIATLEELLVWSCSAYERHNNTGSTRLDPDGNFPVCQFKIQDGPDGKPYFVARVQIEMHSDWTSDISKKIWKHAIEVPGSAALLNGFKS